MTIQHSPDTLRQSSIDRFNRAAELMQCHTRQVRRRTLLAILALLLLVAAVLFGLRRAL